METGPPRRRCSESADTEAPSKAAKSTESGSPPSASESNPHLADHVSASVARPPVHSLGDQPGIRFPARPSGSKTIASIHWLQSLLALGVEACNKTPARCCLRASESDSQSLPLWCPASLAFAGEHASHIL